MFSKVALFASASMAVFVAATPGGSGGIQNSCNTGTVQCCNSVQSANSADAKKAISLLTGVVGTITGQVGLTCTSVIVIGTQGNSCTAQPACCTGNNYSGAVVVGCSPIKANA